MENKINEIAEHYANQGKVNALSIFSKRQFEIAAVTQLSARPYYESRKGLFFFCVILAFVCQVASAVSSYSFFAALAAVKLTGYYLIAATVCILLILEAAKYYLFNAFFADLFRLTGTKTDFGILIPALIVSVVSIYASIAGGAELATDHSAELAVESRFEARKNAIREEIKAITARNTWKGQTWLPKADKALLLQKEKQLQAETEAEQAEKQQAREKNETNAAAYRYGFAGFEVLFIAATLFVWFFRKRVAVEAEAATGTATPTARNAQAFAPDPQQINPYTTDRPRKANPIGFQFAWQQPKQQPQEEPAPDAMSNNAMRTVPKGWQQGTCEHCGNPFTKRTTWHKYCKTECKIAAWEARTGKEFKPKSKKQLDLF